jgi:hypothetical protein
VTNYDRTHHLHLAHQNVWKLQSKATYLYLTVASIIRSSNVKFLSCFKIKLRSAFEVVVWRQALCSLSHTKLKLPGEVGAGQSALGQNPDLSSLVGWTSASLYRPQSPLTPTHRTPQPCRFGSPHVFSSPAPIDGSSQRRRRRSHLLAHSQNAAFDDRRLCRWYVGPYPSKELLDGADGRGSTETRRKTTPRSRSSSASRTCV